MKKENILSARLLVELDRGHRTGLTHAENGRLHGVSQRTSTYAQEWCKKMRSAAESYLKVQTERNVRTYRAELLLDSTESLSLQEGCARHGWPREKYRLLERRERELSGRGPKETETDMSERKRKASTLTDLEKELEAARAENEYLRCENAYLKKKLELEGRPVSLPDLRSGRRR